jgi:hypothetical protein
MDRPTDFRRVKGSKAHARGLHDLSRHRMSRPWRKSHLALATRIGQRGNVDPVFELNPDRQPAG